MHTTTYTTTSTASTSYIHPSNMVGVEDIDNPFAELEALEALKEHTVEQGIAHERKTDDPNWNSIYTWYQERVSTYPRTIKARTSEDIQNLIHIFTINNITSQLIRLQLQQVVIKNNTTEEENALQVKAFLEQINTCKPKPAVKIQSPGPHHPALEELLMRNLRSTWGHRTPLRV